MKILPSFLVTTFLVGAATLASAKPVRPTDNNGDDKISHRERALARFEKIDANDDGVISKDEFLAHAKDRKEHLKDRKQDAKDAKDAKPAKDKKHPNKGKHVKRGRLAAKKIKAA